jgi:predicted outer membrane repeat protein
LFDNAIAPPPGSLRATVNFINSQQNPPPGGDTIKFAQGMVGTINLKNTIEINKSTAIVGNLLTPTQPAITIARQQNSPNFGLLVVNANIQCGFQSLLFQGGKTPDKGGAIFAYSSIQLAGCHFDGNSASTGGGAIYTHRSLDISNCSFSGNSSANGNGGAIWADNLYVTPMPVVTQEVIVTNSVFHANTAQYGGALCLTSNTAGSSAQTASTISFSIFQENSSTQDGGAIAILGKTIGAFPAVFSVGLTLSTSNLLSNRSQDAGGAISTTGAGLEIIQCELWYNRASDGGAIYQYNGNTLVSNSKINENTAVNQGGGFYVALGNVSVVGGETLLNSAKTPLDGQTAFIELLGGGGMPPEVWSTRCERFIHES